MNDHCSWHALKEESGDLFLDRRGLVARSAFHSVKFLPVRRRVRKATLPSFVRVDWGGEKKFQSPAKQAFADVIKARPEAY